MNIELKILDSVRENCAKDAAALDGLPLTGKTVGEMFGKVLASIDNLAAVMQRHIRQQNMLHQGD